MKALVIRGHGDFSMLEHRDMPNPEITRPSDVLVSLKAAALNHLDLWTLRGLPGLSLKFPHVPGADGAGIVAEVGAEVTSVKPGEPVMINPGISCYACEHCLGGEHSLCDSYQLLGEHRAGTLCEYIVLPDRNVEPIPTPPEPHSPISFGEAAAYSLVTLTAWRMLVTRARVKPGEVVLIWGIGGGVSSAAMMIAKLMGAFVFVTSSSSAKLDAAKEMGADVVLNHAEMEVAREVRKLTEKRGVDVVVENVGEATWEQSLQCLAKRGRIVACGATTGAKVVTDVRRLFWHQYTIMGSTMGNAREFREIVQVLGQGRLRPRVDMSFPLARGVEALERLAAGEQMGKIVVEI
jgi:NADPH:quinone reductase-like Zn-dependent oxidoreductase